MSSATYMALQSWRSTPVILALSRFLRSLDRQPTPVHKGAEQAPQFSHGILLWEQRNIISWFNSIILSQSQSQNILVINAQMALNHVKKIVNSYWGSFEPNMGSQQASSRFLKTTTEGELMTKGGNLFHGSTIRTEKAAFRRAKWKERWRNFRSWSRRWEQDGRVKNKSCGRSYLPWNIP